MSKVLVLIPCFNEKSSLLKILKKIKYDVLIMDDCSTDGLSEDVKSLKKKNLIIISNKKNYGYEKNLLKGFKKIIKKDFEYVITFDADGEHNTRDIKRMKNHLTNNDVDEKTQNEWEMQTEDGTAITIYDYKEYREYSDHEKIEWHIGANNRFGAKKGYDELKRAFHLIKVTCESGFFYALNLYIKYIYV